MNRATWAVCWCVAAAVVGLTAAQGDTLDAVLKNVQPLRMERTKAEERVLAIKARFKPSDEAFVKARTMYGDTYQQFDAYETALLLQLGTGANVTADGAAAVRANEQFCTYVDGALQRKVDALAWGTVLKGIVAGLQAVQEASQKKGDSKDTAAADGRGSDPKKPAADRNDQPKAAGPSAPPIDRDRLVKAISNEIRWRRWDDVSRDASAR